MSKCNACSICGEEFPSSLGLYQHRCNSAIYKTKTSRSGNPMKPGNNREGIERLERLYDRADLQRKKDKGE